MMIYFQVYAPFSFRYSQRTDADRSLGRMFKDLVIFSFRAIPLTDIDTVDLIYLQVYELLLQSKDWC